MAELTAAFAANIDYALSNLGYDRDRETVPPAEFAAAYADAAAQSLQMAAHFAEQFAAAGKAAEADICRAWRLSSQEQYEAIKAAIENSNDGEGLKFIISTGN